MGTYAMDSSRQQAGLRSRGIEVHLGQHPFEYALCVSLGWLSNLRWGAGAMVIVATLVARYVLHLGVETLTLCLIGVGILGYNLLFHRWLTQIQCNLTVASSQTHPLARLQIAADWVAMTLLMHFSGGIESPIILYFFFHIALAAILLSPWETYLSAGLAVALVNLTALLELTGVLPHYHVAGFVPVELYRAPTYVAGILFFFSTTVIVLAHLATRITRSLRTREREVIDLSRHLQSAYSRLEALYTAAQAISSTLELQEVLDRLTRSTTEAMRVKGCSIRLLEQTGTELCLASTYGLSETYLQKGCVLVERNPLARRVLAGEVVNVPDVSQEPRLEYAAETIAEGIRSSLSAPLIGKKGPLGLIRVYCSQANRFTQEDIDFLRAIANQGSIAIENAKAFQELQNLEEAKRKFILMVTHELRSPVGVVHSLLRTLVGGYAGRLSEIQADLVTRALKRVEFLQALIDDLLDLAAAKTGLRISTEAAVVDLRRILDEVIERYRIPAEEKGLTLEAHIESSEPLYLRANPAELDRAFTNLVSNAVKYTPAGGRVTVTLERQGPGAYITVKDTGIGIPEEALPHLFEEFYRAPNAKAQVKQGTGLGLVITKDIITRHRGTIRVQSTEGERTTFVVVLPLLDDRDTGETPSPLKVDTPSREVP
ncbi:MAG TPA: GAF domain-containing sensor histidine kinase [Chloroflexi bacterium]|nr:GAF domain-containing sensor histidine kinase [Chloroflexota bacterium]